MITVPEMIPANDNLVESYKFTWGQVILGALCMAIAMGIAAVGIGSALVMWGLV